MAEPKGLNNPLSGSFSPHKSPHLILRNMQSRSTEMNFDSDSDRSARHLFSASEGQLIDTWNSSIFDLAPAQSSLPVDSSLSLSRGHFAKKRAMKQWAASYHQSVQHNVMDEIACVYNRRRYIIAVFDVLTKLARDSRASVAIATADAFALGVVLARWSALARTRYYFKVNLPVAILFRKCSIAIRVFEALRNAKNASKTKLEAARALEEAITRKIASSSIIPWYQKIIKTTKLEDLDAKLTLEVKRRAKHRALLGFCIAYNNIKGARFLVPLVQRLLKSYALRNVVVGFSDFGMRQEHLERDILNIQKTAVMDQWLFATRAKYISRATRTWLMSRTLGALRYSVYRRREFESKRKLIEERLRRLRMVAAMSKLFHVIYKRQLYSKGCERFVNVINGAVEHMAITALYCHAYRDALLNQLQSRMDSWHQQWLLKLALAAIERYIGQKNEKQRLKQAADAHYRRLLACRSFDAMAIVRKRRIEATEAKVTNFVASRLLKDKREALMIFKDGIAACRRLRTLQIEVARVHDRFLALTTLKGLHQAYQCTRALKRELLRGFYFGSASGDAGLPSAGSGVQSLPFTESGVQGGALESEGVASDKSSKPEEQGDTKARRTNEALGGLGGLDGAGVQGAALEDLGGSGGALNENVVPTSSGAPTTSGAATVSARQHFTQLQILTEPLPSECQWFLYTLIGATQRANDLAAGYEYEALDLIVGFNSSLSAQDLRKLQTIKSSQIYVLANSLDDLTDSGDSHKHPTVPEWLKNFLWTQFRQRLAGSQSSRGSQPLGGSGAPFTGSGRSLENSRESGGALLVDRYTAKNVNAALADSYALEDSLQIDALPLWRIVYTKHRCRRLLQWIRNWRAINAHEKRQRQELVSIQLQLQQFRRVATLSYCLQLWSQVASAAKQKRLESLKVCLERLISSVDVVLYKRAYFAFLRLRLTSQVAQSGAATRVDVLRQNLDICILHCHPKDCIELYREYSNLKFVRSCLLKWLLHFKWESATRNNVCNFYKTTFLKKGWDAMYGLWQLRRSNRENASEAIGSLVVVNLAKRHLVAWCLESRASAHYRLLTLRKGMLAWRRFTTLRDQHRHLANWNQQRKLAQFIGAWSTAAKVRRLSRAIDCVVSTLERRLLFSTMSSLHRNALVHARVAKVESMSIFLNLQQVSKLASKRIDAGLLALAINAKIRRLWRRRNRTVASLALEIWRRCTLESNCKLARFCTMQLGHVKSNRHLALHNANCNAALLYRALVQWRGVVVMDKVLIDNLETFVLQRRIKQGLLALYEHAMEQRWHSLCILRCQMLTQTRVLDQKAAIYRWWRSTFATRVHAQSLQVHVGMVDINVATGS